MLNLNHRLNPVFLFWKKFPKPAFFTLSFLPNLNGGLVCTGRHGCLGISFLRQAATCAIIWALGITSANAYYWHNSNTFFNAMDSTVCAGYSNYKTTTSITGGTRVRFKGKTDGNNCEKAIANRIQSVCANQTGTSKVIDVCDCDSGYYSYVSNKMNGGCTETCSCRSCTSDPLVISCYGATATSNPPIKCAPNHALAHLNTSGQTGDYCTLCGYGTWCADYTRLTTACDANYYSTGDNSCEECPDAGKTSGLTTLTSAAQYTKTRCFLPKNVSHYDATGTYKYTNDCYYQD